MKIKPLFDKVLVKPLLESKKTKGGLIVPEASRMKYRRGEVVAVGQGLETQKMIVKPKQVVLFAERSGTEFTFDNQKYFMFRQIELFAIIDEEPHLLM